MMQQLQKPNSAASSQIMAASPISSGASLLFPTSTRDSSTSISVSSYVGSEEVDARTTDPMLNCIRGGDHADAAWQWHVVQHEIDAMVQEISSKAKTQHKLHKALSADFFVILRWHPEEFSMAKYTHTLQKLRESVFGMLHELKALIQKRASRRVPEGGGVHEVTRYVMNYTRLLLHHRSSATYMLAQNDGKDKSMGSLDHIVQDLIICLESMLNRAAGAYDSGGLQCFFLMNNLHFAVKQAEGLKLSRLLGHSWVQVHRDFIDQYMETYVDLSWSLVVLRLSPRKIMLSHCFSQSSNTAGFCLQFDSTYWKVEDPKLREVVRRAVYNKVMSAYQAHIKKSRKVQRLCEWYTPEQLEVLLTQLFEGRTD